MTITTTTTTTTFKDKTMTESARALAQFLADNPEVDEMMTSTTMYIFSYSETEFRRVNALLGTFEKNSDSYGLEAVKVFGKIRLVHSIAHEAMCEKKVVGTKVVKKMVPKEAQPEVEMIEVEEEEEITEWVCPETWR